jgi:type I restriction enzyme S subunit
VSNNCAPEYMEYYLSEPDFIRKMLRFEQGTVYERMSVSPEDFLSEHIRIPDKKSQEKHANLISEIKKRLDSERRLLINWSRIKSHLLSAMFI